MVQAGWVCDEKRLQAQKLYGLVAMGYAAGSELQQTGVGTEGAGQIREGRWRIERGAPLWLWAWPSPWPVVQGWWKTAYQGAWVYI